MFNLNFFKLVLLVSLLAFASIASADVDTQTDENSVILAGHDAVGYFTDNKPVLGRAEFTSVYNDAIYRFSSAKNRDTFNANPQKYAPAYGGYCAYGMTFSKKFQVDGKAFEIVDGQLYVNKNLEVYAAWKKDVPKHLQEANSAWPTVKAVAADKL